MKHDVHLYALVRVKFTGIEADGETIEKRHLAAIDTAIEEAGKHQAFDHLFNRDRPGIGIESVEYADEVSCALVDEQDDEDHENTTEWTLLSNGDFARAQETETVRKGLSAEDLQLLLCAFRYALGRMTYISQSVSDRIKTEWTRLPAYSRAQFKREIREAIAAKSAGMPMDVACWESILELGD